MFRYMNRHLLLVSVFAVASIGLVSSAHAQTHYGIESEGEEGAGGECACVQEIGGAIECAIDGGPCVANACLVSGDAACPNGLCVAAAQIGCATNQCLPQTTLCQDPCPTPSTIGNLVLCVAVPTVSQWGLIVLTLLVLTAGTILVGRRRRAAA